MDIEIRKQILEAIAEIGENIATIKNIEEKVPFERHTLSKYLHIMRKMGYIDYTSIGKAKIWHINKAPLKSIFTALPENMSFSEQLIFDLLSKLPISVMLINQGFEIVFLNTHAENKFGAISEKKFYEELFDYKNPLKLKKIRNIFDKKSDYENFILRDKYDNILKIRASKLVNPNEDISVILIIEDVTKTRKNSRRLRKIQAFFSSTLNHRTEAVVLTDNDFKIIESNNKAVKLFSYNDKKDMLKENILDNILEDNIKEKIRLLNKSPIHKHIELECSIKKKDSNSEKVSINVSVVVNNKSTQGMMFVFS